MVPRKWFCFRGLQSSGLAIGRFSRWGGGGGYLTVIAAVRCNAPPLRLLVTAGDGRDESNQGGKKSLHVFASDVFELVEHGSSQ
jgi:hypothetical protein